jgi:hypothetical protein
MSETALREWLAKRLRLDDVPDELWNHLVEAGYVEDAEVTENPDSLLNAAKTQVRLARVLPPLIWPAMKSKEYTAKPPTTKQTEKVTLRYSAYEKARTRALTEYLAFRVSRNPIVQRFRRRVLGGGVLTPERACSFALSAAACRFSLDWFADKGIPTTGHTAHFVEHYYAMDEDGTLYRAEDIFVDPPGEVFREGAVEPVYEEDLDKLAFYASEHSTDILRLPVESGSVLDELRKASEEVAHDLHHLWTEAQVAWFVLTDQRASVPALRANVNVSDYEWMHRGTITLTVEPWVSAQTVERAYREMQGMVLGGSNRPLATRNLDVFRFVTGVVAELNRDESSHRQELRRLSWRKMLERWNQENPSSEYKDVRLFYRDFLRAAKAVLVPDYYDDALFVREITVP